MLSGLASAVGQEAITAIVNTGDDMVLHGLHISPDIDTVTYTLAGAANSATGWGLSDESWTVMGSLREFEGAAPGTGVLTWFNLGDRDLATHLFRSGRLGMGATLSQVTAEVARRFGVEARLLPMSDDRVETRVMIERPAAPADARRRFAGVAAAPGPRQRQRPDWWRSASRSISWACTMTWPSKPSALSGRRPPSPPRASWRPCTRPSWSSSARPTRSCPSDRSSLSPGSPKPWPGGAKEQWPSPLSLPGRP